MIEIKFRAWCSGRHENMTFTETYMDYDVTIKNGVYADVESGWDINGTYATIPLMQYTGLKDNNGKEIYIGDVLSYKWFVEVYQNNEGTFMVRFGNNPKVNKPYSLKKYITRRNKAGTAERDCIIIGNIHENPELLSNE